MEMHIQTFLNKISLFTATIATLILFFVLLRPPETCIPHFAPHNPLKFPRSTCDHHHHPRPYSTIEKRNHRLWSTSAWLNKVKSFSHVFMDAKNYSPTLSSSLISNSSKSLCILAGAGQEVRALQEIGVFDITAVDLVDSPPLEVEGNRMETKAMDERERGGCRMEGNGNKSALLYINRVGVEGEVDTSDAAPVVINGRELKQKSYDHYLDLLDYCFTCLQKSNLQLFTHPGTRGVDGGLVSHEGEELEKDIYYRDVNIAIDEFNRLRKDVKLKLVKPLKLNIAL